MNQPPNFHAGVALDSVFGYLHGLHRGQQSAPTGFAYVLNVPSLGFFPRAGSKPTRILRMAKKIGHLYLAHDYGKFWAGQLSVPVAQTLIVRLIDERDEA